MVETLAAHGVDDALRAALPVASEALAVRVADEMRVLSLRHLRGGAAVVEAALAERVPGTLPQPGQVCGADPWLVWTGPGEWLCLTSRVTVVDHLMQTLAPGREPLACALDQSAGCLVLDLSGHGLAALLPRLFDASAIAHRAGQCSRTRLIDIGAVLMRLGPERAMILVDSAEGVYAAQWIRQALGADALPPLA